MPQYHSKCPRNGKRVVTEGNVDLRFQRPEFFLLRCVSEIEMRERGSQVDHGSEISSKLHKDEIGQFVLSLSLKTTFQ